MSIDVSAVGILLGCWVAGWAFGLLFRASKQFAESIT